MEFARGGYASDALFAKRVGATIFHTEYVNFHVALV